MTYEEFLELDSIGAYSEFKSVRLAKDMNYIHPDYDDVIPDKCICGSDMIINDNETILMCCDPRCYIKMGYALNNMFKRFDCKGLGPETCQTIVRHGVKNGIFVIPSFIEILYTYSKFEYVLGHRYDDLLRAIYKIQHTPMKFHEMIQYIGVPGYDTVCKDYFGDIVNFDDLMTKLNKYSIVDYLKRFGVNDLKKSLHLNIYLKDIRAFEKLYVGQITKPALRNIDIVITGPVSPNGAKMNRTEFIRYCNNLSVIDGNPIFAFHESDALQSARYFIGDFPSTTRKYKAALSREALNPGLKLIYTSDEFIEMINEEVNKCRGIIYNS